MPQISPVCGRPYSAPSPKVTPSAEYVILLSTLAAKRSVQP